MKREKKRLIGCLAAAMLVVVAVAMACSAIIQKADAVSSITDTIVVKVFDKYPKVTITSPENESILVGPLHEMSFDWESSNQVETTVSYDGVVVDGWVDTFGEYEPGEYPSGSVSHEMNLREYGKYILTTVATGPIGTFEDSIEFSRLATYVKYTGSEENGDPRINIKYDEGVKTLEIYVYDSNGMLTIGPLRKTVVDGTDNIDMTLEMPADAADGEYRVVVHGFDETGAFPLSDASITHFNYVRPIPPVPDTGNFFENLNIARTDYLVTSLLIFFSITAAALFLIYRKKEN